jgi:3-oxoacyl-[acyl-carrier-protein] synthase-3
MTIHRPTQPIYIWGPAGFLPDQIVTNQNLLERWGYKDGLQTRLAWIEGRTGIRERRWALPEQATSDLAKGAALALQELYPACFEDLTHLILATISGDFPSPPTSPLVLRALGLKGIGAFDIGAACAGFVVGLHTAALMNEGLQGSQLLIAADIRSKFLNPTDLSTGILFGDGAAACVIAKTPCANKPCFLYRGSAVYTDGEYADMISIAVGGTRTPATSEHPFGSLKMRDGAALFLAAVAAMEQQCRMTLDAFSLDVTQLAFVVPHQANLLILREVQRRLGLKSEQVVEILRTTGNTSGASVGLALSELLASQKLKAHDQVLLIAAGGGGFVASAILEYQAP